MATRRIPTTRFPHDGLVVGNEIAGRYVRHRGAVEADAEFGEWRKFRVRYVQRDGRGQIAGIAFDDIEAEFDPRHDWSGEGPFPCLSAEEHELQFRMGE
jgi:hypothetical protein